MDKCDVNNFYIGDLNINFNFNELLDIKPKEIEEKNKKQKLIYSTIDNGAINLNGVKFEKTAFFNKGNRYEVLLSIFYKVDDDHYLCLHNRNSYSFNGEDYCSSLVPLKEVVPKIDYELSKQISTNEALKIFNGVFKKNSYFTFTNLHDINEFYSGKLVLCMGYTEKARYHDLNALSRIILNSNPEIYSLQVGSSVLEKNEETDYIRYPSIFSKIDDNLFYNINDYQNYVLEKSNSKLDTNIEIESSLGRYFDSHSIKYPQKITISKILKLQKKIK